jgi:hypothetical protein
MPDVAGGGHVGIALESTHGTYIAPTVFVPAESETLGERRSDPMRKPIMGQAVTLGKVGGREHVDGEIIMEALPLPMVYFLAASRWAITKGGTGPYTYTASDGADAHVKGNDRSLTIVTDRAGIGFAYLGCQIGSMRLFVQDGIPMVAYGIVGREQTEDYTPGAVTIPAETPFAADDIALTVAAGARTDIDSLEITLNDNAEPRFNLSGAEAADYVKFGEFEGSASFEIDFESKADYAIWVARTTQELKVVWTFDADQALDVELHGALYDTFEVPLSAIGDQVRASAAMIAAYTAGDSAAATIEITTSVDVTEIP